MASRAAVGRVSTSLGKQAAEESRKSSATRWRSTCVTNSTGGTEAGALLAQPGLVGRLPAAAVPGVPDHPDPERPAGQLGGEIRRLADEMGTLGHDHVADEGHHELAVGRAARGERLGTARRPRCGPRRAGRHARPRAAPPPPRAGAPRRTRRGQRDPPPPHFAPAVAAREPVVDVEEDARSLTAQSFPLREGGRRVVALVEEDEVGVFAAHHLDRGVVDMAEVRRSRPSRPHATSRRTSGTANRTAPYGTVSVQRVLGSESRARATAAVPPARSCASLSRSATRSRVLPWSPCGIGTCTTSGGPATLTVRAAPCRRGG